MSVVVVSVSALACEPRKVVPDEPKAACKYAAATVTGLNEIVSLAVDARAPGVIHAGTVDGVYVSQDCGATFDLADEPHGVVTVAVGADAGDALAGAAGLWSATSASPLDWSLVALAAPVDDGVTLAVDGATLYAASSSGLATDDINGAAGWLLSQPPSDGGALCVATNAAGAVVRCRAGQDRLAASPSEVDVMYAVVDAAGSRTSAITRSSDGGATFGAAVDVGAGVSGLAVDAGDASLLYVTTTSPSAIFTSADGGATFVQRRTFDEVVGGTDGAVVAAGEAGHAFVRAGNALLSTTNGGVDWDETPVAGAPSAGVVDVARGHVAFNVASGIVLDSATLDLGDRAVAITHDDVGSFYVASLTHIWQVSEDGARVTQLDGDLPRGSVLGVAQSPADHVLRIASRSAVFASSDGTSFAPVTVDVGFPGGALGATATGTLSANGSGGSFTMSGGDVRAVDGGRVFVAVASAPSSRTAWLVGQESLLLSLDGGDTFPDPPLATPVGAVVSTAALDGDALALLVVDDAGARIVDVDRDGTVRDRAPLPCVPAAIAFDGDTVLAGGGDCDLVIQTSAAP